MKIVDVESPYGSSDPNIIRRNILYARIACRHVLEQGNYPYASHLFFTQPGLLDDTDPHERQLGIDAGKSIIEKSATDSWFFLDLGESSGMTFGRQKALELNRSYKDIKLFDHLPEPELCTYEILLAEATQLGYIERYESPGW